MIRSDKSDTRALQRDPALLVEGTQRLFEYLFADAESSVNFGGRALVCKR